MQQRPNVVIIFTDQQRRDTLGCYGNVFTHTPRLDRLASEGLVFDLATTPFPVCTPARASLWTGLYPHAHGLIENRYGVPDLFSAEGRVKETIFQALQAVGYTTAYFGKWHLGEDNPGCFDVWDAFNSRGGHWQDGFQASQGGTWRPEVQTDRCIEFLKAQGDRRADGGDQPFIMVQSYYPPHNPFTAPERYYSYYRDKGVPFAGYYASVSALDELAGRILDTLDETGLADDTLVIFLSDHGETFNYREDSKHKFICFEESIRVPLIARWPGRIGPGGRTAVPVGLQDLTPTLLELTGASLPYPQHGRSLAPLLADPDAPWARQGAYIENVTHDMKRTQRCYRNDDWKLILSVEGPSSLFDLRVDPEEELDLFDAPREDIHDQYRHYSDNASVKRELAAALRREAVAIDDEVGVMLADRLTASLG